MYFLATFLASRYNFFRVYKVIKILNIHQ